MNPILLKPSSDRASQVVVHGKPYKTMDAFRYRSEYLTEAGEIVREAFWRLRRAYDIVVLEGAGSPAEINLKDRDIVNMRMAAWAESPVVLVADIDRGGVFASIVGTLELLEQEERDRIGGFIINKFRGDLALLQPGLDWLEKRTGKPVIGVVPHIEGLQLESEDSLSFRRASPNREEGQLDVAVVRFPRWANFTDIDPLFAEEDAAVRYVTRVEEFGAPDIVLLPGSKNTAEDLLFLRETGLDRLVGAHRERGGWLVGICGGYQMLGERLSDPEGVESEQGSLPGLGIFPMETVFARDKRTERVAGRATGWGSRADSPEREPARIGIEGYEIHMGRTTFLRQVEHPMDIATVRNDTGEPNALHAEGARTEDGRVWGTYIHGILHNDDFRRDWLNAVRMGKGWEPLAGGLAFNRLREDEFDRLADHVRRHVDVDMLYRMMNLETEGQG
jgi:adenosylcobyric acid synthase